jgi:NAD(P)-dependent dehydrogenase (short-subunit alcohol dehydrogenase family)
MVNVIGTFFMNRAAVEYFLGQKKGKIINLTTSTRHFYGRHASPYGVTKAALEASTQIWAKDLEGAGVTINSLLPGGATDTNPNRPKKDGEVALRGSIMNPMLIWLVSDHADGVTGCRFVGKKWDASLPPDEAAERAREEPVFQGQPPGVFKVRIRERT